MEIISIRGGADDEDVIVDDYDLICLFNKFVLENDARQHIVWDALYEPHSFIERKLANDWVRRNKLLLGLSGKTREAMNLAAGELRRRSNIWMEEDRLSKVSKGRRM